MATLNDTLMTLSDMSNQLLREAWSPRIIDAAFDPQRSWFMGRIPRSSEGINGLTVKVPFVTQLPGGWRGMDPRTGYTPSGAPFSSDYQYWSLGCSAASATLSHQDLKANKLDWNKLGDLVEFQMDTLKRTFPYYMRGLLWSSNDADATVKNAIGVAASVSSLTVTLDNDGLWHSDYTRDYATLFEPGMYVAVYSSAGVLRTDPTVRQVTAVDKKLGTITLDDVTDVADGDFFVFSDIAGLEVNGPDEFPGILDIIDDDNTFQNVDRSTNSWAQAVVTDAAADPSYSLFSDFFSDCFNPKEAYTHTDVIRKYWDTEMADKVRFTQGDNFVDGFQSVKVDNTTLVGDWDCPRDRVIVPDFANMRIAELGEIEPLDDEGWRRLEGRPVYEKTYVYWGRPVAEDCRRMGQLHGLTNVR